MPRSRSGLMARTEPTSSTGRSRRRVEGALCDCALPHWSDRPNRAKAELLAKYVTTRLFLTVPTLLLLSILVFGAIRVIPGDVCQLILQSGGTQQAIDSGTCRNINHALGLDKPVTKQYVSWFSRVLTGDLGKSLFNKRPVLHDIN